MTSSLPWQRKLTRLGRERDAGIDVVQISKSEAATIISPRNSRTGSPISNDGTRWTVATASAVGPRPNTLTVVFDGKIWLYGGLPGVSGKRASGIPATESDGTRSPSMDPWFPRTGQYTIAFNEKLWIFRGKTGTHYKHADDIWYRFESRLKLQMSVNTSLICHGLICPTVSCHNNLHARHFQP